MVVHPPARYSGSSVLFATYISPSSFSAFLLANLIARINIFVIYPYRLLLPLASAAAASAPCCLLLVVLLLLDRYNSNAFQHLQVSEIAACYALTLVRTRFAVFEHNVHHASLQLAPSAFRQAPCGEKSLGYPDKLLPQGNQS